MRRPAAGLWLRKSEAEEATRLINPPETLDAVAKVIGRATSARCTGLPPFHETISCR